MKNLNKLFKKNIIQPIMQIFGVVDIKGDFYYPACALSNCAKEEYSYSFIFDNIECKCMESFLQCLKCEDIEKQKYICSLNWRDSQKIGREIDWTASQTLWWKGKAYNRDSKEYQELLDNVYLALFDQNEGYRKALIKTGNKKLIHSIGKKDITSTVLTEQELCSRLTNLREKTKKYKH